MVFFLQNLIFFRHSFHPKEIRFKNFLSDLGSIGICKYLSG